MINNVIQAASPAVQFVVTNHKPVLAVVVASALSARVGYMVGYVRAARKIKEQVEPVIDEVRDRLANHELETAVHTSTIEILEQQLANVQAAHRAQAEANATDQLVDSDRENRVSLLDELGVDHEDGVPTEILDAVEAQKERLGLDENASFEEVRNVMLAEAHDFANRVYDQIEEDMTDSFRSAIGSNFGEVSESVSDEEDADDLDEEPGYYVEAKTGWYLEDHLDEFHEVIKDAYATLDDDEKCFADLHGIIPLDRSGFRRIEVKDAAAVRVTLTVDHEGVKTGFKVDGLGENRGTEIDDWTIKGNQFFIDAVVEHDTPLFYFDAEHNALVKVRVL